MLRQFLVFVVRLSEWFNEDDDGSNLGFLGTLFLFFLHIQQPVSLFLLFTFVLVVVCYVDTILSSHVSMLCVDIINSNKQIQYGASGVVGARHLHIFQN